MFNPILFLASPLTIDPDILIKLCERLASLEAKLDMHFLEHNRIWFMLIPIVAGIIISILQNIYIGRKVDGNNKK